MHSQVNPGKDEQLAWLTLKLIPGLGNRSILRLVERFGSPNGVLLASGKELASVKGVREKARLALQKKETLRPVEVEMEKLEAMGIRLISINDPGYPANLKTIPDAPAVLFVKGALEPRDLVSIAVVGSRSASPLGIAFTERLCMDLSRYGVTIVSGLAVGIDSAAHRGALKSQGRTIAVLGCGLDVEYPKVNRDLRRSIIASGAVVTEFPLGTLPASENFPMRNRIISGLTLGVVVVEAAHRSGSLITARYALEQGREVFAVPGLARQYRSIGPHRLLKQGAKLVETAEDVLEEIRPLIKPTQGITEAVTEKKPAISDEEARILEILDRHPKHIDDICRILEWPMSKVMVMLSALELKGIVRQLPGKHFVCDDGL